MGEVWRARDTRLKREVAVKVLPQEVAGDPDRLRRFEQEALAASALNHPGIVTVHDFGTDGGVAYLVTELLEGETLREALARAPFSPRRSLDVALQLARALAAAHDRGIVHRDLKPENVFLVGGNHVKILDFGLAKQAPPLAAGELTAEETLPRPTEPGTVMGTAGYMAPEQVRGEPADERSDVFAFGCVLYEMVAGRRAFGRSTAVESLAAILNDEPPPPEGGRAAQAPALLVAARRCLEKRREERFQSARDLAFALEAVAGGTVEAGIPAGPSPVPEKRAVRTPLAAALLLAAAAGLLGYLLRGARPSASAPGPGAGLFEPLTTDPGYEGEPTFSPDGETIAYVSDRDGNFEIYLQQVAGGPAINLTRNPAGDIQPAFSPDGHEIAFVSDRSSGGDIMASSPQMPLVGGDIWVMPALGGPARRVVEAGNFPSFSPDGARLVYTHGPFKASRLAIAPATGGASSDLPLTGVGEGRLCWPSFSSDGRWILFQEGQTVRVVAAGGGEARRLAGGEHPAWGPGSDSVLFTNDEPGRSRTLWEAPFSRERGELSGPLRPVTFGRGPDVAPAVSRDGRSIVFSAQEETLNVEELPFDAEAGRILGPPRPVTSGSNDIGFFGPSPDGSSVVFGATRGLEAHLWRVDLSSAPVPLTLDRRYGEGSPQWSPDGQTIAFDRWRAGDVSAERGLWVMKPDGAAPRRLADTTGPSSWLGRSGKLLVPRGSELHVVDATTGEDRVAPGLKAWTLFAVDAAGEWIAYQALGPRGVDIEAVKLSGGTPRLVVSTPRSDFHPFFSPSGRWLYFQPDHKNVWRVPGPAQDWRPDPPQKVTDFPEAGLYLEDPCLSADGRHLFYTRGRTVGDLFLLRLPPTTAPGPPAPGR